MSAHSAGFTPLPDIWKQSETDTFESLGALLREEALHERQNANARRWSSRRLATGEMVSAFVATAGLEYYITKRVDQFTNMQGTSEFIAYAHRIAQLMGVGEWTCDSANAEVLWEGAKVKVIIVRYGAPYTKASKRLPVPTPPPPRGGR